MNVLIVIKIAIHVITNLKVIAYHVIEKMRQLRHKGNF